MSGLSGCGSESPRFYSCSNIRVSCAHSFALWGNTALMWFAAPLQSSCLHPRGCWVLPPYRWMASSHSGWVSGWYHCLCSAQS